MFARDEVVHGVCLGFDSGITGIVCVKMQVLFL